jgi:hypothetical protein
MHDRQQQEERPGEMHEMDAVAHRMLDEPRQAGQQARDAEAGHDADDEPDMYELIVRDLGVLGCSDPRSSPGLEREL